MADSMVTAGVQILFEQTSGSRTLLIPPMAVVNSVSTVLVVGQPASVAPDLSKVVIGGIPYEAGNFSIPGVGMVQGVVAASDQVAKKTLISGQPALLKGGQCQGFFIVTAPATDPSSGVADAGAAAPTPIKGRIMVVQQIDKAT